MFGEPDELERQGLVVLPADPLEELELEDRRHDDVADFGEVGREGLAQRSVHRELDPAAGVDQEPGAHASLRSR
ncbi:hypothetical protein D3C86_2006830 [compost metagenome]